MVQSNEVERGSESWNCSEGECLKGSAVDGTEKLREYMCTLFKKSCQILTRAQAKKVLQVLLKFLEVFAAADLDIGRFTALVHYIRTGSAFPIKQGMRRTPLGFEQEGKKDNRLYVGCRGHRTQSVKVDITTSPGEKERWVMTLLLCFPRGE